MNIETYLKDIYCDKCNKETVVENILRPNPFETPKKSMVDYRGSSDYYNTVYLTSRHVLTCKSCGNTREFTT